MKLYSDLIKNLVLKETNGIDQNTYFLSAYIPAVHLNGEEIKNRVKSYFLSSFRLAKHINKCVDLHYQIIEKTINHIDKIKDFKDGLAIFIKFKVINCKLLDINNDDISIIPMIISLEKKIYIGKVFNVDQLVWLNGLIDDGLILSLKQEDAFLYFLKDGDLKMIKKEENQYISDRKEKEDLGQFSPTNYKKSFNRSGENKVERDKLERARGFLSQISETLKNEFNNIQDFNYFIIVYSSSFNELIKTFNNQISKKLSHSLIFLNINKNIKDQKELKVEVFKKIIIEQRKIKRSALDQARESYDNYVEGWKDVIKAANLNKIKTLFIKVKTKARGYLLNKELIFDYPVKGAMMVKNIAPWLIKNVITSSGEIIVFKQDTNKDLPDVAAELWY